MRMMKEADILSHEEATVTLERAEMTSAESAEQLEMDELQQTALSEAEALEQQEMDEFIDGEKIGERSEQSKEERLEQLKAEQRAEDEAHVEAVLDQTARLEAEIKAELKGTSVEYEYNRIKRNDEIIALEAELELESKFPHTSSSIPSFAGSGNNEKEVVHQAETGEKLGRYSTIYYPNGDRTGTLWNDGRFEDPRRSSREW